MGGDQSQFSIESIFISVSLVVGTKSQLVTYYSFSVSKHQSKDPAPNCPFPACQQ